MVFLLYFPNSIEQLNHMDNACVTTSLKCTSLYLSYPYLLVSIDLAHARCVVYHHQHYPLNVCPLSFTIPWPNYQLLGKLLTHGRKHEYLFDKLGLEIGSQISAFGHH